jgi:SAM-dependent methyltransferase
MVSQVLGRVCTAVPGLRRALWKSWYELLAGRYRQPEWTFMNYGYAPAGDDGSPLHLEAADEPNRHSLQLYHHVTGSVDLDGAAVLEVGSGRGGGCAYLARYRGPEAVLGVDLSRQAVEFCRRVQGGPRLSFQEGDAEALPCEESRFDAVVNVESSHCYGSMEAFVREVYRVLKPGGHFLWADMRPAERVEATHRQLAAGGFALIRERRITANVLRALDRMSEERTEMIRRLAPRWAARPIGDFAGVRGTRVYESLASGAVEYVSCVLRKPER